MEVVAPKEFVEAIKVCVTERAKTIGAKVCNTPRCLASRKGLLNASVWRSVEEPARILKGHRPLYRGTWGADYSASVQVSRFKQIARKSWMKGK